MIGAIIGDIVGSRFEFLRYKHKEFVFFDEDCFFTDDSVMTLAVGNAIMLCNGDYRNLEEMTINEMKRIGINYPDCGYGGHFYMWLFDDNDRLPYNSYGNGAAMRVAAAGYIGKDLDEVIDLAVKVTKVTHNHPEGLRGAEATAVCIYMAKNGSSKAEIKKYVEDYYYKLNFTIDEIRPSYLFNETCQYTVPQAIECFLESNDFEDAIRLAVSLGGDSDTLACIAGSIAGAYYGVPKELKEKALTYLDDDLKEIYLKYESAYEIIN